MGPMFTTHLHACTKRNAKVERVMIEKIKHSSIGQTPPVPRETSNFLLLCLIVSVFLRGPETKSPPVALHSSSPSSLHVCSHRVSCCVKGYLLSTGGGLQLTFSKTGLPAPVPRGLSRAPRQCTAPHWSLPSSFLTSPIVSDSESICPEHLVWCLGLWKKEGSPLRVKE